MEHKELITKALGLLKESNSNEKESDILKVYNAMYAEIEKMDKEFDAFKDKNPKNKNLEDRQKRINLLKLGLNAFKECYFNMVAYKTKSIQSQTDTLEIHTKYKEIEDQLNEYKVSKKIDENGTPVKISK
jgi:DNA repair ATPase RecN